MAFSTSSLSASDGERRRLRCFALRHAAWLALTLAAGLHPADARAQADDKEACMRSYEQAQRARKMARFLEAKQELSTCLQACPLSVRSGCSQWLEDTERRMPTLLVDAVDADGRPMSEVRVLVDEKLVALHAGRPIEVDPGEHTVRLEAPLLVPSVQHVVVRESEKGRRVTVRFDRAGESAPTAHVVVPAWTAPPPSAPTSIAPAPEATKPSGLPAAAYVAAGVGAVGLIGFVAFGVRRVAEVSSANTCSPTCAPADISTANRDLYLAGGSLALALAGGATAAYIYFVGARSPAPPTPSGAARSPTALGRTTVSVAPLAAGAEATLAVRF
jgi:hypothetical protein